MKEERFTNTEIKLMFENVELKLDAILEQTTKHNGRMTTLEGKVSTLEKLRWILYGAGIVILFVGIPEIISVLA